MQTLEVTLPGLASSVPPARHFVQRALTAWGAESAGWTAALLVSELAANAALHAGTDFTVVVQQQGERVRIEVQDGSAHLPRTRHHSAEATTGRGLRLVAELAVKWGVRPLDRGGKAVWAELSTAVEEGTDDAEADDVDALLAAFDDGPAADLPGTPHLWARAA